MIEYVYLETTDLKRVPNGFTAIEDINVLVGSHRTKRPNDFSQLSIPPPSPTYRPSVLTP